MTLHVHISTIILANKYTHDIHNYMIIIHSSCTLSNNYFEVIFSYDSTSNPLTMMALFPPPALHNISPSADTRPSLLSSGLGWGLEMCVHVRGCVRVQGDY